MRESIHAELSNIEPLDELEGDHLTIGYLRRILQDEDVTVAILPSGKGHARPIPAEVWSVDRSLQLQNISSSPGYSNITEAAITSRWCKVEATLTSKHNKRYAALAAAFQDGPPAR